MIKFIAAAVWICAAMLGAVFYSFQAAGAKAAAEAGAPPSMMGGLDFVKTDIMSVPLVRNARIDGYFLARLVYTADPAELKKMAVPADAIITDVVYSYIYSNPQLDFTKTGTLDLDAFRAGIRDIVNEKVKRKLIEDVLIDQIDYLSKDEIRASALKRRSGDGGGQVPLGKESAQPAAEKPAH